MTVSTDHNDLLQAFVIENLILAVELILIVELEFHPRPDEGILLSLLLQSLLKIDPPIHLRLQIRDQQLRLPRLLEHPHIEGHNVMLQLQIILLPLVEPPKYKDLPFVLV